MSDGFDRLESFGHDELTAKHCYFRCSRPPDVDGIKFFDKDDQAVKHKDKKQVDILISKNQALQVLYLKHIKPLHKLPAELPWIETHENLIPTNDIVQFYCYITIVNKTYLMLVN